MGVPAFYRWITEKYSKIVVDILEKRSMIMNGMITPVDLNESNPNQFEFDNLYIDMNGLIHPCSHPEDREAPRTEEEMYINVTKYLDRLIAAIRPRNLLFLAIDGVAPRAKMNQQRSRRFRSAQEAKERKEMKKKILQEMIDLGISTKDEEDSEQAAWDSNVITPGTEFMTKISMFLKFYILEKMNRPDPYWKKITIILSDASEPGEGEHKIMDFIRKQRIQPNYNPNIHHVIHGLDADLIMLGLATHEPHFTILREKVFFQKKGGGREGGSGGGADDSKSQAQKLFELQYQGNGEIYCPANDEWVYHKPLEALHIFYLREYLQYEFSSLTYSLPFLYDFERIIDDFIFLCFFVGNDFLPHLPSLDIRDGALDFLLECYKETLPKLGNYITNHGGNINLLQADVILSKVGEIEDQIFQRKKSAEDQTQRRNDQRRQNQQQNHQQNYRGSNNGGGGNQSVTRQPALTNEAAPSTELLGEESLLGKRKNPEPTTNSLSRQPSDMSEISIDAPLDEEDEEAGLTEAIAKEIVPKISNEQYKEELKNRLKAKEQELIETYKSTIVDTIKLHEQGWKDRYYEDPFKKKDIEQGGGFQKMCYTYVQGLCWVLKYYYEGVPSWNWYYPFHYAPFASDLLNIDSYGNIEFEKSSPFSPLEQLLAVFPPSSAFALPEECRWLMLDPESPIIDIYDENIPIDANGKHLPWLWILLLPFLDETRITAAFNGCRPNLTLESLRRNACGKSVIFVHKESLLGQQWLEEDLYHSIGETDPDIVNFFERHPNHPEREISFIEGRNNQQQTLQAKAFIQPDNKLYGIASFVPKKWYVDLDQTIFPPVNSESWWEPLATNKILCLQYELPSCTGAHQSVLLPNVMMKPNILSTYDYPNRRPPRLNKSGFNILDLFAKSSQHQQQQSRFHQPGNQNDYQSNQFHYNTGLPRGLNNAFQQLNQRPQAHQVPPSLNNFGQQQFHQPQQQQQQQQRQQQQHYQQGHYQQQQQQYNSQNQRSKQGERNYNDYSNPPRYNQTGFNHPNHRQSSSTYNSNNNNHHSGGNHQQQRQQPYNNHYGNRESNRYEGQDGNSHSSAHLFQQPTSNQQHYNNQVQQTAYPVQSIPQEPTRNIPHRVETLQSNLSRAINYNTGRNFNNRPSKTVMISNFPPAVGNTNSTSQQPQQQPQQQSSYQGAAPSFSFNSRSTVGNDSSNRPVAGAIPQSANSMQFMRDQLLQTMNKKGPPRK